MNDNLPEINFKEKKEKKGGVLGWLRGNLGGGARGALGGPGITPSAMNVGRALGTAKIGASSAGVAGLLAGKAGIIATIALVSVAGGMYMVRNAQPPRNSAGSFNSSKAVQENYVPAILRNQGANQDSLGMFKDTNKGAGLAMEAKAKPAAAAAAKPAEGTAAEQPAGQPNVAEEVIGKLQGGEGAGSLTSSLGEGGNKFSAMGGFGNKFNQGATGSKPGFSSGIGAGFSAMPKFDARKSKLLAMKGSKRPVFSGSKSQRDAFGTGAFKQAKGLRATQKTYAAGGGIDSARSTQDQAWEGATPEGEGSGGAGVGEGGAGVVSSPSLDNPTSGGSGDVSDVDPESYDCTGTDCNLNTENPWQSKIDSIQQMLTFSLMLTLIGCLLQKLTWPPFKIIGRILCGVGAILGAIAMVQAIGLMKEQAMLGGIYLIGGALAVTAGIIGACKGGAEKEVLGHTAAWYGGAAGILSLMASMMAGK